jgi:uncharacterized protein YjiK
MTRSCERAAAIALTLLSMTLGSIACSGDAGGQLAQYAFDAPSVQWELPKRLREISGLATTPDGRLFAHEDERAIVYEIDYREGRIVKAFALGDTDVRDDFEGIAIAGADFYLMTSAGRLYRTREGGDGERVAFSTVDTGLGARCELEGLAWDAGAGVLLMPCKLARAPALEGRVAVFAWSPNEQRVVPSAGFEIDERALAERIGAKHFNASSIEMYGGGGRVLLLAGRQHALAEVDRSGAILGAVRLSKAYHRQPEGVALSPDGGVIVADEGEEGRARLAVYRRK